MLGYFNPLRPHSISERIRMIATHPALSNVRITTFKGTRFVPRVRNKWISNITTKHYNSVSFHDGVANIVP